MSDEVAPKDVGKMLPKAKAPDLVGEGIAGGEASPRPDAAPALVRKGEANGAHATMTEQTLSAAPKLAGAAEELASAAKEVAVTTGRSPAAQNERQLPG